MHNISIEALPKDLPQEIKIDISSLKTFDDQILISNITLPEGVTATQDPEEVVALVQPAREYEEPESTDSGDVAEVEVEKKGKEEVADEEV